MGGSEEGSPQISHRSIPECTVVGIGGGHQAATDEVDQERGWKLFFLLLRMLLHKVGGGAISRSEFAYTV